MTTFTQQSDLLIYRAVVDHSTEIEAEAQRLNALPQSPDEMYNLFLDWTGDINLCRSVARINTSRKHYPQEWAMLDAIAQSEMEAANADDM